MRAALFIGQPNSLCEAICKQLVALSYHVVVMTQMDDQQKDEWLMRMNVDIGDLRTSVCHIKDDEEAERHVISIDKEKGQIDFLILALEKSSPTSLVSAAENIGKDMLCRGHGRIVLIDAVEFEGEQEEISQKHQTAKVSPIQPLAKRWATEAANSNVTINTITAGQLENTIAKDKKETSQAESQSQARAEHLIQQQEIARLVAYLVLDEAAFISGANIAVNTGRYMN